MTHFCWCLDIARNKYLFYVTITYIPGVPRWIKFLVCHKDWANFGLHIFFTAVCVAGVIIDGMESVGNSAIASSGCNMLAI